MKVIAFVVSRYDVGRTFWILHHLVEVDDESTSDLVGRSGFVSPDYPIYSKLRADLLAIGARIE